MNTPLFARKSGWFIAGIWLIFLIALALAGWGYFHYQEKEFAQAARHSLGAIADLKAGQIAQWYQSRQADAEITLRNPMIVAQVRQFLANPTDAQRGKDLLTWMEEVRKQRQYSLVALWDRNGKILLSVPPQALLQDSHYSEYCQAALRAKRVIATDLHRGHSNAPIHLGFWIPVGIKPGAEELAEGAFLFQVDPQQFLYGLIQSWPTPSQTAETLLVRREGDEVVYLNELRHRTNTALTLRVPVTRHRLPAAQAVRGYEGIVEGLDYRGVPVLAATRAVEGTPWYMVAKVDQSEVFAPLRERAWVIAIITLVLWVAASLGVAFVWKHQKLEFVAQQFAERERAEEEVRRLNQNLEKRVRDRTAQLEGANKDLEAFSYSVSHDLRAPLRAIDGFADMLMEEYAQKLDGEGQRVLKVISNESKRMGQLIDDLLNFSRLGRREMVRSEVKLDMLAQTVWEEIQRSAPARAVDWELRPLPPANGDAGLLRQVFTNLLSNAFKFTQPRNPARVEMGALAGEGEAIYYVKDNGVGFDMRYVQKLFCIFQRLHTLVEFEGTGVGLALVKGIIQRHGGRVWAEGKVGEGATFYFTLPN